MISGRINTSITACAISAAIAIGLGGCGEGGPREKGLEVTGPGVRSTQPPWAPEYGGLDARIHKLGLPTGSSEKFHIHAELNIYNQGLLVTIPANVGIDERRHLETTIHTHDFSGIVHMEAPRPFRYTLGDSSTFGGSGAGRGRSAVSRTAGPTGCGPM